MKIRTLIVIPTFDNPATIGAVVRDLLAKTELPLLVVDDGSRRPVEGCLKAELGTAPETLTVVRHPVNRGKGAALRTAMEWAIAHEFTHMLSFDGDGQHLAAAAVRLAQVAAAHPWSLVIGAREFPEADVPGISRFGRAFSNFWVRYETGVAVSDSQSGLRVYPLLPMQGLRFLTVRYDFEVESLTRLLWAGVDVVEVPVDVFYPPAERRVSHFRKGRDNARISLLNTWLVTASLFARHLEWKKVALASLAGPLLAFLPLHPAGIFGLMALAAVLLQLNGWLCLGWYVAGMALPPLLSRWCGLDLRGVAWPAVPVVAWSLAAGAWIMGNRSAPAPQWTGKSRGGRFGNLFFWVVSRWLGRGATYACLAFIAPYFYPFAPRARRSSAEYFRALWPKMRWLKLQGHIVLHFYTFGTVLLDRLFQSLHQGAGRQPGIDVRLIGRVAVDKAAEGGRGVLVLTAHAGGWGLATRSLAANELGRQSAVAEFLATDRGTQTAATVRASEQKGSDHMAHGARGGDGSQILAYKERLESGQIVAMMADRPMTEKLALVPFLGKMAAFDLAPFRLALALGVDLVYCFAFKKDYSSYDLEFEGAPPLRVEEGQSKDAACEIALRHFTEALARRLRRHPHQWFNFYPFFSTRPVAPNGGEPGAASPAGAKSRSATVNLPNAFGRSSGLTTTRLGKGVENVST